MRLITYVIGVVVLCGIPDAILFRLFYKWKNKTLIRLQWISMALFLAVFAYAMVAIRFTVSMIPMLAFGFVFFLIYLPKWFFWPFALAGHLKIGSIFAAIAACLILYGTIYGRRDIVTRQIDIYSDKIPESFDGYRIAMFSDIHLGSLSKTSKWINALPDSISKNNPDIVLFTGDLVNMYAKETNGWDNMFLRINAPDGKYGVMGNHDYSVYLKNRSIKADSAINTDNIRNAFNRFGFTLLNDKNIFLRRGNDSIALIGTENIGNPPFPVIGNIDEALSGTENTKCKIMMTHDPNIWDDIIVDKRNVLLTLSGHSHALQMGFDHLGIHWSPAQFIHEYWDGPYQKKDQILFVNRGMGYVGYPFRIGMKPEITLIILHPSKKHGTSYKLIKHQRKP